MSRAERLTSSVAQLSLKKTAQDPDEATKKRSVIMRIVAWWLATVPVAALASYLIAFIEYKIQP